MMTRRYVGRLAWLAPLMVLAGILLLVARIDIPTWPVRDSSVSERLTALVTCVLPATADDPLSTSARVPETTAPDCEASTPNHLRAAWMTAC